jgi:hypothetical protein
MPIKKSIFLPAIGKQLEEVNWHAARNSSATICIATKQSQLTGNF